MVFVKLFEKIRIKFSPQMGELYSYIKQIADIQPNNLSIYMEALRHKSAAGRSNERLEYLGDALISLVVAEDLYTLFSEAEEGLLTKLRAQAVCRDNLNRIAHQIRLDLHLQTGAHIKKNTENIFGNAFEAMVGAIYLDAGYQAASAFVRKYITGQQGENLLKLSVRETDFKSRLLEYAQARKVIVEFKLLDDKYDIKEDRHCFIYEIFLDNKPISTGSGHNKAQAQQAAAQRALRKIKIGS